MQAPVDEQIARPATNGLKFDFYLSEMAVSNGHGGGLTLQRVLADELDCFQFFVHVSEFATQFPSVQRLRPRCLELPILFETQASRKLIGCTASDRLSRKPLLRRMHTWHVARTMSSRFTASQDSLTGLVCPQSALSLHALEALIKRRPVDYVTWMMDDHLVRWRNGDWHYPPEIEQLLARHLKGAKSVLVISPALRAFYQRRFGVDSRVLFGPAIAAAEPVWQTPHADGGVRLGYFGALGPWQIDALEVLAAGLEAADARLDIYSAYEALPAALQLPGVTFKGRLEPTAVPSLIRTYDAVVLPASFHTDQRHLSEFNIATKMSECLASGTVTLVVAPPYAAMAQLLERNGAAVVIQEPTIASVAEGISQVRDKAKRRELLTAAVELVERELCPAAMRATWRDGTAWLRGA